MSLSYSPGQDICFAIVEYVPVPYDLNPIEKKKNLNLHITAMLHVNLFLVCKNRFSIIYPLLDTFNFTAAVFILIFPNHPIRSQYKLDTVL